MDNGVLFSDLRLYLIALHYVCDTDCSIGNCQYWERSTGENVTISIDGDRISSFMLNRILTKIGKRKEDLALFIEVNDNIDK